MKLKVLTIIATTLLLIGFVYLYELNANYKVRKEIGLTFRQFVLACQVYPNNSDSVWPTDIEFLLKVMPEIKTEISKNKIEMMLDESRTIYVRPVSNATSDQPVFISNPEIYNENESVIGYADGHIGYAKGDKLWLAGKRLIRYTAIYDDDKGIKKFDWKIELEK